MAILFMTGFEWGQASLDGVTLSGTASISTVQARTGARALRCNPASGATGFASNIFTQASNTNRHFAFYIATLPSVQRIIAGATGANATLRLESSGAISGYDNTPSLLFTGPVLSTGRWYSINWSGSGRLSIDGTVIFAQVGWANFGLSLGCVGTEASAIDIYFDDVLEGGTLGSVSYNEVKVALLRPISDNSNTNWTAGAGATTSLFDGVDNVPPASLASASETNT